MFNETHIKAATDNLINGNPLLTKEAIRSTTDLAVFMVHHVYAVWDFMCLAKSVQHAIAPTGRTWKRNPNGELVRFINEMILGEESDHFTVEGREYTMSHFDMYLHALDEVVELIEDSGNRKIFREIVYHINKILPKVESWFDSNDPSFLLKDDLDESCIDFMLITRDFCQSPVHITAAAFAYGRENLIPGMFDKVLDQLKANSLKAPFFQKYLERHIELDGDEHGPMATKLVEMLCQNAGGISIEQAYSEAENAALKALDVRANFWVAVDQKIKQFRTDLA